MIKNGQYEQKGWEPTLQGGVRQPRPRGMIGLCVTRLQQLQLFLPYTLFIFYQVLYNFEKHVIRCLQNNK